MKTENVEFQLLDIFSELELYYNLVVKIRQLPRSEYLVRLVSDDDAMPMSVLSEITKYIERSEAMTDYKCHKYSFKSVDSSFRGALDWTQIHHSAFDRTMVRRLENMQNVELGSVDCLFKPI